MVEECAGANCRTLVLTFTLANQKELRDRLAMRRPLVGRVEVRGWFSFLLGEWVRPYLPRRFQGRRLEGLNFDGDPGRYAKDERRFLDDENRAYRRHLAQLAVLTNAASRGAVVDRICRMYDQIHVDEIQDLNGYDLEVLALLLQSGPPLHLVGDVRQALISTNERDPKHKQYKGIGIKTWFELQEKKGVLEIDQQATTWRSNQMIADFADSIFDAGWGFEKTTSMNSLVTGHDGLFAIRTEDVDAYVEAYRPLCLRHSANSARKLDLNFTTFRMSKGRSADRILIAPTNRMVDFLRDGKRLDPAAACSLYVGVTRARFSVAFVSDDAAELELPLWTPA
ncbi:MAG: UvrD-helicase domain-containing protein [Actinomycetota bacterium]|nr:UvrD-helicase domain-containing protein [Actinomycetota bacterium]